MEGRQKAVPGAGRRKFPGASNPRHSRGWGRNRPTKKGGKRIPLRRYKPGRGKIKTCSSDDKPTNNHALGCICRTRQNSRGLLCSQLSVFMAQCLIPEFIIPKKLYSPGNLFSVLPPMNFVQTPQSQA